MSDRQEPDKPRPGDPSAEVPRPSAASGDLSRTHRGTPASSEPDRPHESPGSVPEALPGDESGTVPPQLEMPTAGRRPASVTGPIGRPIPRTASPSPEEPTVAGLAGPTGSGAGAGAASPGVGAASPGVGAGSPGVGAGSTGGPSRSEDLADEETRPLSRPVAEETRPLRRPPLDDGETRVLRPPAAAETPRTSESTSLPAPEAPRAGEGTSLSTAETLNLDDGPTVERDRPAPLDAPGAGVDDLDGPTRRFSPVSSESAGGDEGAGAGASPERVAGVSGGDEAAAVGDGERPVPEKAGETTAGSAAAGSSGAEAGEKKPVKKKVTSAGALIWVLLLLLGYTLVVQLRSNNDDQGLATARQEDLVSILSDLESRDSRLQTEIQSLEASQRQLTSGVSSRQAALDEAEKRAGELGLLAGTLPGKGPGLKITIDKVKASEILNAVQELRGSGGEVMELAGVDGSAVRIVASSYFVDAQGGGIDADGTRLSGPWTLWVIGSPQTMQTALQIPGGVVASINGAGGSVTMEAQTMVEVTAVRKAGSLQYAKPTS